MRVGGKWETSIFKYEVVAIEKVKVSAGEFSCYKVIGTSKSHNISTIIWFNAEVKYVVKNEVHTGTDINTTELIEYKVSH